MNRHPTRALFGADGGPPIPILASCDHYAGSERFITKALELQATLGVTFDVTMDLEDGAPAGHERQHAEMVVDLLRSSANVAERAGVRIHDPRHPAFATDVDVVVRGAGRSLHHLTIPKVRSVADVVAVVEAVDQTTRTSGIDRLVPLHVLVETHGALEEVFAIAAHPRVRVLDFGIMDFVSDHWGAIPREAMRSPLQFEHPLVIRAKTRVAAAALAHGAVPAHNVTIDLEDEGQAGDDAARAHRELGFLRMWSVHPKQIVPIVSALCPSFDATRHASKVLLAGQRADWGPTKIDGTLYDRASYRYEWTLLERARLAGVKIPEEAAEAFFSGR